MAKTKKSKGKEEVEKKKCGSCDKEKKLTDFYMSYSEFHKADKRVPYCKNCITNLSLNKDKSLNLEKFKNVLMNIDKPFLQNVLQESIEEAQNRNSSNIIGIYCKNLQLNYKEFTWKDGESNKSNNIKQVILNDTLEQFEVTPEMISRWGTNYEPEQIRDLELFYNDMKITHTIVTPQHIKALIMMCKMQLKMDQFLENNDMTSFSKLHDQYQKLLTSSGLRPIDKVGGDEATGMRSFSHIFEEVERDGFIEPTPIKEKQDIIDKTIQYIMNYTIRLLNQQVLVEPPPDTPKVDE